MRNRSLVYLLAIALAAPACSTSSSDDIWMPPGAGGKADGYTSIRGSDIPSAYVDANKSYMISRQITSLTTVGALDATEEKLAKRVDGIIANMPADGRIHLAELVRMEDPSIFDSLFPEEKTALPKLWKLVEAPDSNDSVYGPQDNFGVLDASTTPAAAVPPDSLAISGLVAELQDPAKRLENVYDSDSSASTVTLEDLASGVANPGAFTPDEVTAFGKIQAVFRQQAVADGDAKLVLSPGPGSETTDATLGPAKFHLTGTTKIDEQRTVSSSSMQATLVATQSLASTVDLPASEQVIALNQDTGAETVFGAGTVPSLSRGEYVFEVWKSGHRAFATNAELPAMSSQDQITLNDDLDYTVVSGLSPLVRNLSSATMASNGYYYHTYTVHYTYDKMTIAPPADAVQAAVQATTTPTVTLAVGRYSFPQSHSTFYVYPHNVLWMSVNGTMRRLMPQGNNGSAPTRFAVPSGVSVQFDATSSTLSCGSCSPAVSVRLDASMRDI